MKLSNTLKKVEARIDVFAKRLNSKWLTFAVMVIPLAVAFIMPLVLWGKTIFAFIPNSSDEVTYWREINTYVDYGFGGGQYSNDELIAAFTSSHFGTHGPAFAITYGTIGKLIGWQGYTPVIINFSILALAILISVRTVRPNNKQLLVLLVLLVTWWPLQLYLTSNMQEALHSSAAILLAALFYRLFSDEKGRFRYTVYIALLLIFLVSFRYIWALLLFPAILFPMRPNLKSWVGAMVGTGVLLAAGAWFVTTFYSPSPWFWTSLIETFMVSKSAALAEFQQHFVESLQNFVSFDKGLPLVIVLRYQVLGILIASGIRLIRPISTKSRNKTDNATTLWFTLFTVGSVLTFVLFFYDVLDTRDYRMLVGPLLLSIMLLVFVEKLNFVYPIIAMNLISVVFFISYYPSFRTLNFDYDPDVLLETSVSINSNIQFEPLGDRWCNTISISKYGEFNAFSYPLTAVHSGFGTTTILEWKQFLDRPLQAKYVILDPEYSEPGFGNPVNHFDLIEITPTPIGTLFLNPHSACDN